jgi:hypothetical protein
MYLRLILIFTLFFICGPVGKAEETVNAVSIPDTQTSHVSKAPDEITLEANAVEIILNDEHHGGVDWGAIVSDFHTVPLKKENDPAWNDKKRRLSFGTVSQDDYSVLLDALDTVGQMGQFPQAAVKVISGVPASISFEKQGIHVDFLLSRLKSGDLSLQVDPHIPALLHADTNILIANDTVIIIGGLIKEEEITRKHKFPLLGDIPIVGPRVFRYKGHLIQKTETVLFLTVRAKAVEAPEEDNLP